MWFRWNWGVIALFMIYRSGTSWIAVVSWLTGSKFDSVHSLLGSAKIQNHASHTMGHRLSKKVCSTGWWILALPCNFHTTSNKVDKLALQIGLSLELHSNCNFAVWIFNCRDQKLKNLENCKVRLSSKSILSGINQLSAWGIQTCNIVAYILTANPL